MTQSIKPYYCKECGEACEIAAIEEEIYPGIFTTLFCSHCCQAEVVTITGRFIHQGELDMAHTTEKSYQIDLMSDVDLD